MVMAVALPDKNMAHRVRKAKSCFRFDGMTVSCNVGIGKKRILIHDESLPISWFFE
ncbi:MAG: hypothetical protein HY254_18730 [Burkholderiales bacterium]|nr:hypothetical protein [Burkholderiales bacterium]